jgi:hypothetical protein
LRDGDPVGAELHAARERALQALLTTVPSGTSAAVVLVRKDFKVRLAFDADSSVRPEAVAA